MTTASHFIPVDEVGINLIGPALRRAQQFERKYADAYRQFDAARIVALAEQRGLVEVEARR